MIIILIVNHSETGRGQKMFRTVYADTSKYMCCCLMPGSRARCMAEALS